ncbi:MAG: hypothetical protein GY726_15165 [Proteobacteria bacterium]|nr:hypothetical protein [Pseudomonadota bacterium]
MRLKKRLYFYTIFMMVISTPVHAVETLIELGLEGRVYAKPGPPQTPDSKLAISLQPEFTEQIEAQNLYLRFEPYFRLDQIDEERNHADIRELKALKVYDNWEIEGGIGQVFWGVAESNHLVDIINQTDFLEGLDGEDKLGQPLLRSSRIFDQSTLSAFVLPGFRERQFLGPESRFALPFTVDSDAAQYESDKENEHVDYALRYNGYAGLMDYGLSWFKGTARNPMFRPSASKPGMFVPYYEQVERAGLDVQYTVDAWLWKLEAVHQTSSLPSFSAYVGGLEYTFYNLHDGLYDLGLLAEYNHDSRGDPQTVFYQNDVFVATRFAFTDADSSAILAGAFVDMDDDSRIFRIEASKRVFGDATLSLEAQVFSNTAPTNINSAYSDSDFLKLEIAWFF